jgi:hypothetical protein
MSASSPELILRAYHGRENGLMIIGNAEALNRLGAQLQAASDAQENSLIPDWPPLIANPEVSSPYLNGPDFKLSFHVMRRPTVPPSLPLIRRSPPGALVLIFGILALIGAATIVTLAVKWLL